MDVPGKVPVNFVCMRFQDMLIKTKKGKKKNCKKIYIFYMSAEHHNNYK